MSSFRAVNTTLTVVDSPAGRAGEETTPTTPRPLKPHSEPPQTLEYKAEDPSAKTPTRDSFHGVAGQRPLPASPFTPASEPPSADDRSGVPKRESSHRSTRSVDSSQDVDMDDGEDDDKDSDAESATSETNRPSKKKKGQRFFCTDFPPCQLSFTRSEHLARHIRKHTGERPFQCHCSRRFSRLDNLRQHAQTVHVNEDIPGDSLAATGTRFQRQIRTDRVRPPANRSRASTLGSQGSHSRGHSRNLSASSIASTSSSVSQRDDPRRRPTPLAVANDTAARTRLTLDTFNPAVTSSPGQQFPGYVGHSPNGFSTPASATYSGDTGSPGRFSSGLQSPISTVPRQLAWESKPASAARRLSVPSGANPFQAPPGSSYGPPPYITPLPSTSGSTVSANSSLFASPTSSTFSMPHRDPNFDEAEWRRRTWHPSTYTGLGLRGPGMSGLNQWQTPNGPPQGFAAPQAQAANQVMRLPGIESFDHVPPQSSIRRQPSPMQIDSPHRPPVFLRPMDQSASGPDDRRGHASWDAALHKGLTKLEINSTPPRESPSRHQHHASQGSISSQRPGPPPQQGYFGAQGTPSQQYYHSTEQRPHTIDQPSTPRRNKRQAWYGGPLPGVQPQPGQQQHYFMTRTSPEDSSSSEGVPTPSSSQQGEIHPAIRHSNGYVEAHPPGVPVDEHNKAALPQQNGAPVFAPAPNGQPHRAHPLGGPQIASFGLHSMQNGIPKNSPHAHHSRGSSDMMGLEALVAAATREEQRAVSTHP